MVRLIYGLPHLGPWRKNRLLGQDSKLAFYLCLGYQALMNNDSIQDLARKLAESLPAGVRSMRDEMEQNFRAVLQNGLSRLDLVTREEFEVQEAVLARTRQKLEALEARLEEYEAEL